MTLSRVRHSFLDDHYKNERRCGLTPDKNISQERPTNRANHESFCFSFGEREEEEMKAVFPVRLLCA